ncbi:unnamed protein product [Rotaria sp. Silwood2]|nr:unnamed protein product [Rotaria sp. Silwood2]CAF4576348.1 unnamed protein product [Rotaria sp. Silwood2]
MTDLQNSNNQIDPKINIYFQNKRIRRHLIKAGLINREGEILPPTTTEVVLNQRSRRQRRPISADKLSRTVHHYILEEEQKRRTHIRNRFDFSVKRVHVDKKTESKHTRRGISHSSLNVRHSPTLVNILKYRLNHINMLSFRLIDKEKSFASTSKICTSFIT